MAFKHPYQIVVADRESNTLYAAVRNSVLAFRLSDGSLVGSWTSESDSQNSGEELGQPSAGNTEHVDKKPKTNRKTAKSLQVQRLYEIQDCIRSLILTRDEQNIVCTTEIDKAAVILKIDVSKDNCLQLRKRQVFPKRPCAVSTTLGDTSIILADKFGDVYDLSIDGDRPVPEKDLVPILGHVSMLGDVVVAEHEGQQFILTSDRDEHIKVSHYPMSYVVKHWLFGHREFVSCLHLASFNKDLLISGGGDDFLLLWNWWTEHKLAEVNIREHIVEHLTDAHLPPERFLQENSVKEISVARVVTLTKSQKNLILVLCENTNCILVFTVSPDYVVSLISKSVAEHPIVDITLTDESVLLALDTESNELIETLQFTDDLSLEKVPSKMANSVSLLNPCEVDSRKDLVDLYHIHTLRKRSEH